MRQAPIQTTRGIAPTNLNLHFEPDSAAMFTSAQMQSPEQMQPITMRNNPTDTSHELCTERDDITNLVTMLNTKPAQPTYVEPQQTYAPQPTYVQASSHPDEPSDFLKKLLAKVDMAEPTTTAEVPDYLDCQDNERKL